MAIEILNYLTNCKQNKSVFADRTKTLFLFNSRFLYGLNRQKLYSEAEWFDEYKINGNVSNYFILKGSNINLR